jgi:hypothetical protein
LCDIDGALDCSALLKSLDSTLVIVNINRDFRYRTLDDCHVSLYLGYIALYSAKTFIYSAKTFIYTVKMFIHAI